MMSPDGISKETRIRVYDLNTQKPAGEYYDAGLAAMGYGGQYTHREPVFPLLYP
jgi:hypothetical protein